ncbi:hypothetical protein SELMODRAFT_415000 [Selaginella moellendorffii]|uniref:Uncharacterized protein n=1 Tax=Selaginella moellendorffii TaxID=88036 RepID=D8RUA2_SELML|nr:hypothetical protein SELMODRAFT_415000 [Selaginella moellendorffii]
MVTTCVFTTQMVAAQQQNCKPRHHVRGWEVLEGDSSLENAKKSKSSHFEPVKIGKNVLALRSIENRRFVNRHTDYWKDSLNTAVANLNREQSARFTVSKPVGARNLTNIKYLLELAEMSEAKNGRDLGSVVSGPMVSSILPSIRTTKTDNGKKVVKAVQVQTSYTAKDVPGSGTKVKVEVRCQMKV